MNLYIEVEVFDREFKSRFLLACKAALKGFNTFILSREEMHRLILSKSINSGIYHTKDANSSIENIEFLKKIKNNNFLITAQDEEAGLTYNDYNNFILRRYSSGNSFKYIDLYFCYGKLDFESLSKKFTNGKFYISGSPRFDLANEKFYQTKESFLEKIN